MVWFTADQHFFHDAAPTFKGREFSSIEEMHKAIIEKWNLVVEPTDTVYVLGDYCFGTDIKALKEVTSALHGAKILIMGNHDTFSYRQYVNCGFKKVYDLPVVLANDLILSHEPLVGITGDGMYNIHGHTHGRPFTLQSSKHYCVSLECNAMRPVSYSELQKLKYLGGAT